MPMNWGGWGVVPFSGGGRSGSVPGQGPHSRVLAQPRLGRGPLGARVCAPNDLHNLQHVSPLSLHTEQVQVEGLWPGA